MPDSKISALPSATVPLAGTEVLPIVQSSVTDKVAAADLLRQNGQTVTTSNPVLSLAQTWNAGGVTFTGLRFNATNTASASGSLLLDLQTDGVTRFAVGHAVAAPYILTAAQAGVERFRVASQSSGASVEIYSGGTNSFLGFGTPGSTDTNLFRDAANTLALRNGTNAQAFRVYNTYTDASNYERLDLAWAANTMQIQATKAGTGTNRAIALISDSSTYIQTSGGAGFRVDNSGNFRAITDNAVDIGASGATRPRMIYAGTRMFAPDFYAASNGILALDTRVQIASSGDGILRVTNWAGTDFTRLQFGGTTSSFPALKRNGTGLDLYAADESSRTALAVGALNAYSAVTTYAGSAIPAGGSTGAGYKLSSTANFGVFFGSGAPTLSAAKGSLYLRSDGSTTNDRCYVNTDGSTTWTAVTTAA